MTNITHLDSPYILEGTAENFNTLVLDNSEKGPVVVNYWSPNAGPCLRLYPILDKLIHEFQGRFLLINLDTEEYGNKAREYGVTSLPTLKLFENREVVETVHGYRSENDLRGILNRHVALNSDVAIARAVKVYQQGHREQALKLLAQAALADPENLRIPLTLGKLLMREQRHEEAHRLLDSMPDEKKAVPAVRDFLAHLGFILAARQAPEQQTLERQVVEQADNLEARYQLCAVKLVKDDYEGAMALLLEIMRKDSEFRNGAGRSGLLAIFNLLGDEAELVERYRKLMAQYMH